MESCLVGDVFNCLTSWIFLVGLRPPTTLSLLPMMKNPWISDPSISRPAKIISGDDDEIWEAAIQLAIQQAEDHADLLDLNFDSPNVDAAEAESGEWPDGPRKRTWEVDGGVEGRTQQVTLIKVRCETSQASFYIILMLKV